MTRSVFDEQPPFAEGSVEDYFNSSSSPREGRRPTEPMLPVMQSSLFSPGPRAAAADDEDQASKCTGAGSTPISRSPSQVSSQARSNLATRRSSSVKSKHSSYSRPPISPRHLPSDPVLESELLTAAARLYHTSFRTSEAVSDTSYNLPASIRKPVTATIHGIDSVFADPSFHVKGRLPAFAAELQRFHGVLKDVLGEPDEADLDEVADDARDGVRELSEVLEVFAAKVAEKVAGKNAEDRVVRALEAASAGIKRGVSGCTSCSNDEGAELIAVASSDFLSSCPSGRKRAPPPVAAPISPLSTDRSTGYPTPESPKLPMSPRLSTCAPAPLPGQPAAASAVPRTDTGEIPPSHAKSSQALLTLPHGVSFEFYRSLTASQRRRLHEAVLADVCKVIGAPKNGVAIVQATPGSVVLGLEFDDPAHIGYQEQLQSLQASGKVHLSNTATALQELGWKPAGDDTVVNHSSTGTTSSTASSSVAYANPGVELSRSDSSTTSPEPQPLECTDDEPGKASEALPASPSSSTNSCPTAQALDPSSDASSADEHGAHRLATLSARRAQGETPKRGDLKAFFDEQKEWMARLLDVHKESLQQIAAASASRQRTLQGSAGSSAPSSLSAVDRPQDDPETFADAHQDLYLELGHLAHLASGEPSASSSPSDHRTPAAAAERALPAEKLALGVPARAVSTVVSGASAAPLLPAQLTYESTPEAGLDRRTAAPKEEDPHRTVDTSKPRGSTDPRLGEPTKGESPSIARLRSGEATGSGEECEEDEEASEECTRDSGAAAPGGTASPRQARIPLGVSYQSAQGDVGVTASFSSVIEPTPEPAHRQPAERKRKKKRQPQASAPSPAAPPSASSTPDDSDSSSLAPAHPQRFSRLATSCQLGPGSCSVGDSGAEFANDLSEPNFGLEYDVLRRMHGSLSDNGSFPRKPPAASSESGSTDFHCYSGRESRNNESEAEQKGFAPVGSRAGAGVVTTSGGRKDGGFGAAEMMAANREARRMPVEKVTGRQQRERRPVDDDEAECASSVNADLPPGLTGRMHSLCSDVSPLDSSWQEQLPVFFSRDGNQNEASITSLPYAGPQSPPDPANRDFDAAPGFPPSSSPSTPSSPLKQAEAALVALAECQLPAVAAPTHHAVAPPFTSSPRQSNTAKSSTTTDGWYRDPTQPVIEIADEELSPADENLRSLRSLPVSMAIAGDVEGDGHGPVFACEIAVQKPEDAGEAPRRCSVSSSSNDVPHHGGWLSASLMPTTANLRSSSDITTGDTSFDKTLPVALGGGASDSSLEGAVGQTPLQPETPPAAASQRRRRARKKAKKSDRGAKEEIRVGCAASFDEDVNPLLRASFASSREAMARDGGAPGSSSSDSSSSSRPSTCASSKASGQRSVSSNHTSRNLARHSTSGSHGSPQSDQQKPVLSNPNDGSSSGASTNNQAMSLAGVPSLHASPTNTARLWHVGVAASETADKQLSASALPLSSSPSMTRSMTAGEEWAASHVSSVQTLRETIASSQPSAAAADGGPRGAKPGADNAASRTSSAASSSSSASLLIGKGDSGQGLKFLGSDTSSTGKKKHRKRRSASKKRVSDDFIAVVEEDEEDGRQPPAKPQQESSSKTDPDEDIMNNLHSEDQALGKLQRGLSVCSTSSSVLVAVVSAKPQPSTKPDRTQSVDDEVGTGDVALPAREQPEGEPAGGRAEEALAPKEIRQQPQPPTAPPQGTGEAADAEGRTTAAAPAQRPPVGGDAGNPGKSAQGEPGEGREVCVLRVDGEPVPEWPHCRQGSSLSTTTCSRSAPTSANNSPGNASLGFPLDLKPCLSTNSSVNLNVQSSTRTLPVDPSDAASQQSPTSPHHHDTSASTMASQKHGRPNELASTNPRPRRHNSGHGSFAEPASPTVINVEEEGTVLNSESSSSEWVAPKPVDLERLPDVPPGDLMLTAEAADSFSHFSRWNSMEALRKHQARTSRQAKRARRRQRKRNEAEPSSSSSSSAASSTSSSHALESRSSSSDGFDDRNLAAASIYKKRRATVPVINPPSGQPSAGEPSHPSNPGGKARSASAGGGTDASFVCMVTPPIDQGTSELKGQITELRRFIQDQAALQEQRAAAAREADAEMLQVVAELAEQQRRVAALLARNESLPETLRGQLESHQLELHKIVSMPAPSTARGAAPLTLDDRTRVESYIKSIAPNHPTPATIRDRSDLLADLLRPSSTLPDAFRAEFTRQAAEVTAESEAAKRAFLREAVASSGGAPAELAEKLGEDPAGCRVQDLLALAMKKKWPPPFREMIADALEHDPAEADQDRSPCRSHAERTAEMLRAASAAHDRTPFTLPSCASTSKDAPSNYTSASTTGRAKQAVPDESDRSIVSQRGGPEPCSDAPGRLLQEQQREFMEMVARCMSDISAKIAAAPPPPEPTCEDAVHSPVSGGGTVPPPPSKPNCGDAVHSPVSGGGTVPPPPSKPTCEDAVHSPVSGGGTVPPPPSKPNCGDAIHSPGAAPPAADLDGPPSPTRQGDTDGDLPAAVCSDPACDEASPPREDPVGVPSEFLPPVRLPPHEEPAATDTRHPCVLGLGPSGSFSPTDRAGGRQLANGGGGGGGAATPGDAAQPEAATGAAASGGNAPAGQPAADAVRMHRRGGSASSSSSGGERRRRGAPPETDSSGSSSSATRAKRNGEPRRSRRKAARRREQQEPQPPAAPPLSYPLQGFAGGRENIRVEDDPDLFSFRERVPASPEPGEASPPASSGGSAAGSGGRESVGSFLVEQDLRALQSAQIDAHRERDELLRLTRIASMGSSARAAASAPHSTSREPSVLPPPALPAAGEVVPAGEPEWAARFKRGMEQKLAALDAAVQENTSQLRSAARERATGIAALARAQRELIDAAAGGAGSPAPRALVERVHSVQQQIVDLDVGSADADPLLSPLSDTASDSDGGRQFPRAGAAERISSTRRAKRHPPPGDLQALADAQRELLGLITGPPAAEASADPAIPESDRLQQQQQQQQEQQQQQQQEQQQLQLQQEQHREGSGRAADDFLVSTPRQSLPRPSVALSEDCLPAVALTQYTPRYSGRHGPNIIDSPSPAFARVDAELERVRREISEFSNAYSSSSMPRAVSPYGGTPAASPRRLAAEQPSMLDDYVYHTLRAMQSTVDDLVTGSWKNPDPPPHGGNLGRLQRELGAIVSSRGGASPGDASIAGAIVAMLKAVSGPPANDAADPQLASTIPVGAGGIVAGLEAAAAAAVRDRQNEVVGALFRRLRALEVKAGVEEGSDSSARAHADKQREELAKLLSELPTPASLLHAGAGGEHARKKQSPSASLDYQYSGSLGALSTPQSSSPPSAWRPARAPPAASPHNQPDDRSSVKSPEPTKPALSVVAQGTEGAAASVGSSLYARDQEQVCVVSVGVHNLQALLAEYPVWKRTRQSMLPELRASAEAMGGAYIPIVAAGDARDDTDNSNIMADLETHGIESERDPDGQMAAGLVSHNEARFAFAHAGVALRWAIEEQEEFMQMSWPAELAKIDGFHTVETDGKVVLKGPRLRIGVHTDRPGAAEAIASALCRASDGGETRMSEVVYRAVSRTVRDLIFPSGAVDVDGCELATFVAYSKNAPHRANYLMGASVVDTGMTKHLRRGAIVQAPFSKVALVFTDIQSSTELWETSEAGMSQGVKLHHITMRAGLKAFEGYEVKTEGDAFMVAFHDAAKAAQWCLKMQEALLELDYPRELLTHEVTKPIFKDKKLVWNGFRVRMGIHVGFPRCEPDPVTGRMDYYGNMVNKAARVAGLAQGGRIVVSEEAFDELKRDLQNLGSPVITRGGRIALKGIKKRAKIFFLVPRSLKGRNANFETPKPEWPLVTRRKNSTETVSGSNIGKILEERNGEDAAAHAEPAKNEPAWAVALRQDVVAKMKLLQEASKVSEDGLDDDQTTLSSYDDRSEYEVPSCPSDTPKNESLDPALQALKEEVASKLQLLEALRASGQIAHTGEANHNPPVPSVSWDTHNGLMTSAAPLKGVAKLSLADIGRIKLQSKVEPDSRTGNWLGQLVTPRPGCTVDDLPANEDEAVPSLRRDMILPAGAPHSAPPPVHPASATKQGAYPRSGRRLSNDTANPGSPSQTFGPRPSTGSVVTAKWQQQQQQHDVAAADATPVTAYSGSPVLAPKTNSIVLLPKVDDEYLRQASSDPAKAKPDQKERSLQPGLANALERVGAQQGELLSILRERSNLSAVLRRKSSRRDAGDPRLSPRSDRTGDDDDGHTASSVSSGNYRDPLSGGWDMQSGATEGRLLVTVVAKERLKNALSPILTVKKSDPAGAAADDAPDASVDALIQRVAEQEMLLHSLLDEKDTLASEGDDDREESMLSVGETPSKRLQSNNTLLSPSNLSTPGFIGKRNSRTNLRVHSKNFSSHATPPLSPDNPVLITLCDQNLLESMRLHADPLPIEAQAALQEKLEVRETLLAELTTKLKEASPAPSPRSQRPSPLASPVSKNHLQPHKAQLLALNLAVDRLDGKGLKSRTPSSSCLKTTTGKTGDEAAKGKKVLLSVQGETDGGGHDQTFPQRSPVLECKDPGAAFVDAEFGELLGLPAAGLGLNVKSEPDIVLVSTNGETEVLSSELHTHPREGVDRASAVMLAEYRLGEQVPAVATADSKFTERSPPSSSTATSDSGTDPPGDLPVIQSPTAILCTATSFRKNVVVPGSPEHLIPGSPEHLTISANAISTHSSQPFCDTYVTTNLSRTFGSSSSGGNHADDYTRGRQVTALQGNRPADDADHARTDLHDPMDTDTSASEGGSDDGAPGGNLPFLAQYLPKLVVVSNSDESLSGAAAARPAIARAESVSMGVEIAETHSVSSEDNALRKAGAKETPAQAQAPEEERPESEAAQLRERLAAQARMIEELQRKLHEKEAQSPVVAAAPPGGDGGGDAAGAAVADACEESGPDFLSKLKIRQASGSDAGSSLSSSAQKGKGGGGGAQTAPSPLEQAPQQDQQPHQPEQDQQHQQPQRHQEQDHQQQEQQQQQHHQGQGHQQQQQHHQEQGHQEQEQQQHHQGQGHHQQQQHHQEQEQQQQQEQQHQEQQQQQHQEQDHQKQDQQHQQLDQPPGQQQQKEERSEQEPHHRHDHHDDSHPQAHQPEPRGAHQHGVPALPLPQAAEPQLLHPRHAADDAFGRKVNFSDRIEVQLSPRAYSDATEPVTDAHHQSLPHNSNPRACSSPEPHSPNSLQATYSSVASPPSSQHEFPTASRESSPSRMNPHVQLAQGISRVQAMRNQLVQALHQPEVRRRLEKELTAEEARVADMQAKVTSFPMSITGSICSQSTVDEDLTQRLADQSKIAREASQLQSEQAAYSSPCISDASALWQHDKPRADKQHAAGPATGAPFASGDTDRGSNFSDTDQGSVKPFQPAASGRSEAGSIFSQSHGMPDSMAGDTTTGPFRLPQISQNQPSDDGGGGGQNGNASAAPFAAQPQQHLLPLSQFGRSEQGSAISLSHGVPDSASGGNASRQVSRVFSETLRQTSPPAAPFPSCLARKSPRSDGEQSPHPSSANALAETPGAGAQRSDPTDLGGVPRDGPPAEGGNVQTPAARKNAVPEHSAKMLSPAGGLTERDRLTPMSEPTNYDGAGRPPSGATDSPRLSRASDHTPPRAGEAREQSPASDDLPPSRRQLSQVSDVPSAHLYANNQDIYRQPSLPFGSGDTLKHQHHAFPPLHPNTPSDPGVKPVNQPSAGGKPYGSGDTDRQSPVSEQSIYFGSNPPPAAAAATPGGQQLITPLTAIKRHPSLPFGSGDTLRHPSAEQLGDDPPVSGIEAQAEAVVGRTDYDDFTGAQLQWAMGGAPPAPPAGLDEWLVQEDKRTEAAVENLLTELDARCRKLCVPRGKPVEKAGTAMVAQEKRIRALLQEAGEGPPSGRLCERLNEKTAFLIDLRRRFLTAASNRLLQISQQYPSFGHDAVDPTAQHPAVPSLEAERKTSAMPYGSGDTLQHHGSSIPASQPRLRSGLDISDVPYGSGDTLQHHGSSIPASQPHLRSGLDMERKDMPFDRKVSDVPYGSGDTVKSSHGLPKGTRDPRAQVHGDASRSAFTHHSNSEGLHFQIPGDPCEKSRPAARGNQAVSGSESEGEVSSAAERQPARGFPYVEKRGSRRTSEASSAAGGDRCSNDLDASCAKSLVFKPVFRSLTEPEPAGEGPPKEPAVSIRSESGDNDTDPPEAGKREETFIKTPSPKRPKGEPTLAFGSRSNSPGLGASGNNPRADDTLLIRTLPRLDSHPDYSASLKPVRVECDTDDGTASTRSQHSQSLHPRREASHSGSVNKSQDVSPRREIIEAVKERLAAHDQAVHGILATASPHRAVAPASPSSGSDVADGDAWSESESVTDHRARAEDDDIAALRRAIPPRKAALRSASGAPPAAVAALDASLDDIERQLVALNPALQLSPLRESAAGLAEANGTSVTDTPSQVPEWQPDTSDFFVSVSEEEIAKVQREVAAERSNAAETSLREYSRQKEELLALMADADSIIPMLPQRDTVLMAQLQTVERSADKRFSDAAALWREVASACA
ncbi:Adenylate cyclase [Diplonema papillatum]|nr:Adenylate cyclase [Diplonema papillatum]